MAKSSNEGHIFGPYLVKVRDVTKSSEEGHIFGPYLVEVRDVTKSSDEGHIFLGATGCSKSVPLLHSASNVIDITLIFDAHSKIVASHQHRYIAKSIIIKNISPFESGQSNDKVLRREAYLFLVEPYLVDVRDVTFLPIAWQNQLYLFNVSTTISTLLSN